MLKGVKTQHALVAVCVGKDVPSQQSSNQPNRQKPWAIVGATPAAQKRQVQQALRAHREKAGKTDAGLPHAGPRPHRAKEPPHREMHEEPTTVLFCLG